MDDPNRLALASIAESLGSMNQKVVYVGDVVAGLLITDPAAAPVRTTADVDCIIEIQGRSEYDTRVRSLLIDRGFVEMQGEGNPMCAWQKDSFRLDVMPDEDRSYWRGFVE